jgi:ATP synthase protein I
MDERKQPPSLDDIEQRLRAAQARNDADAGRGPTPRGDASGMGIAARITVELVVSVMVGGGIGYGLDHALGTKPWLMLVFLFLGGAAGVMNAYRAAKGLDDSVGLGGAMDRKRRRDQSDGS